MTSLSQVQSISAPAGTSLWSRVTRSAATVRSRVGQAESAIVMSGRAVAILAGLASSILTARYLAPAGRGEYFLAITMAQLIAQFGHFGLSASNTYFVARDWSLNAPLLANSLWISFIAVPALAALGLGLSARGVLGGLSGGTGWFVLALAPVLVFSLLGNSLLIGLGRVKMFSVIQALLSAAVLPCMLVAAALGAGPRGFLLATLVGSVAAVAVMLTRLCEPAVGSLQFRTDTFAATFRYSMKAYLVTLAGFIVLRVNVFILQAHAGATEVGYYSVASQIADTLSILPQSMAVVLFPRLAAMSVGRFRATLRGAARTGALISVLCLVAWLLADFGIRTVFGPRFAPAVPVLRAMLPGVLLLGVMVIVSQYLAASGFPAVVIASWAAAVVFNVLCAQSFVPRYGAVGAGLSLSLTYGVLLLLLIALSWRIEAGGSARVAHERA